MVGIGCTHTAGAQGDGDYAILATPFEIHELLGDCSRERETGALCDLSHPTGQKLVLWSLSPQMQGYDLCSLPLARVGGEGDIGDG